MRQNYYRLLDDINFKERWYLGEIINQDNWKYTSGESVNSSNFQLKIEIFQEGKEMDFTLNEAYGVPIVSESFKKSVSIFNNLSFIPVLIENRELSTNYYIMVIEKLIEAVDEDKSEFDKFTKDDPIRPDKAGQYLAFYKLIIDPSKVQSEDIFRLKGFTNGIIISGKFKSQIQSFTGCKPQLLNGTSKTEGLDYI